MRVTGIDERNLRHERLGTHFVVFIYEGGDDAHTSWSVDSYLLSDADLPSVLHWLRDNLPSGSCWALGVVQSPEQPTAETDVDVAWVVGADVLNIQGDSRDPAEQRQAEQMLARRDSVTLP